VQVNIFKFYIINTLNNLYYLGDLEEKFRLAFAIYDVDMDGYLSNGDLFKTLKLLVGDNLNDIQIQQLVDRSIIEVDKDLDGKISYEEFRDAVKHLRIREMFSMKMFGQ
jgi:serine/threonine-protein phosphatase 2B regulatory subunit